MAVLWGDLAPVLETAAAQSDVQSEQYSMLSTLRDAAQLASGASFTCFAGADRVSR